MHTYPFGGIIFVDLPCFVHFILFYLFIYLLCCPSVFQGEISHTSYMLYMLIIVIVLLVIVLRLRILLNSLNNTMSSPRAQDPEVTG